MIGPVVTVSCWQRCAKNLHKFLFQPVQLKGWLASLSVKEKSAIVLVTWYICSKNQEGNKHARTISPPV